MYLFGNPPYLGAKKQSKEQKEDLYTATDFNEKYKKMDYISGWFTKGANFINNTIGRIGFVTTNSICQGEQVSMLWPNLLEKVEIYFAYKSFKWNNNAKNNAGVTVTIIGLRNISSREKRLYSETQLKTVKNISPYLVEGENTYITSTKKI